jgi:hypothetical protein
MWAGKGKGRPGAKQRHFAAAGPIRRCRHSCSISDGAGAMFEKDNPATAPGGCATAQRRKYDNQYGKQMTKPASGRLWRNICPVR